MKTILTYDNFLIESLRDKMTPKSEEDIKKVYAGYMETVDNPISDFPPEFRPKFEEISELFKVDQKDLHLITEDEGEYGLLDEFFESLVQGDESVNIDVPDDEVGSEEGVGGQWICYPDQQLAKWSSDDMGGISGWIFNKGKYLNN